MGSHCECDEENDNVFLRIIISAIFFAAGLYFKPYSVLFFATAYLICGYDVILRAIRNFFKGKLFDENFLMSVATLGAFYINEFPEAAMVMILYQTGEYFQDKAVHKSGKSIEALIDIRPEYAIVDGKMTEPSDVKIGDVITVKAGEKISLDGKIISGNAAIDMSALTGESVPIEVCEGMEVLSGGINLNGIINIKVTKEYKQSTAYKVLELIKTSAEKKAKTEKFITRFAKIYTPIVILLAILIFIILPLCADISYRTAFERALTFLVISCPCALVISVPLTFFAGIGASSTKGILIKGGNFLEQAARTGMVVFDKTGTLTTGVFGVKEINSDNPDFLKYIAIAESVSSHPIARAILMAYKGDIPDMTNAKEYAGNGVEVFYDGKTVKAGTAKFIGVNPIESEGTVVYLSINGVYEGNIVLSDIIKEDSQKTVSELHDMNIKTAMITGDTKERAEYTAKQINIGEVYSELLPAGKVSKLEELILKTSSPIMFAGEGINDAPVLKRADVGIGMGCLGSDAAVESADIVIMDDKPSKIVDLINISRKTMFVVKQNIVFAIGIKIIFLILGGFGFVTMWGAVFADVGVALIAIANALRVKTV